MKKCKEVLKEVVVFLLQAAESKRDSAKFARLLKSGKPRSDINYKEVLERMEQK